jgi:hypothetical protein
MTESNQNQPEKHPRFSQQQYDLLLRCSEKKDMTEWNQWRKAHPDEDILLERADLDNAHLEAADLQYADLRHARLQGAHLVNAVLNGAKLRHAHLDGANLRFAHIEGAGLRHAHLEGTSLWGAHLEGADLSYSHLEDAILRLCYLEGTRFDASIVDGSTLLWKSNADKHTDFRGVGLGNLQYNIRRMNWEDWYKQHPNLKWLVKLFWLISDYGMSTKRIVATFFILAFIFAAVYFIWGLVDPPGIVSNLFALEGTNKGVYTYAIVDYSKIEQQPAEPLDVPLSTAFFRVLYFSIVTQTTLGFGDLYANPQRITGHILLSLQVILGYVLLGALVTRFAVLFTAGGPAAKFAKAPRTSEQQVEQ